MIQFIKNWVQIFTEIGSTINQPLSGRPRTSRDPEKVERVRASVREQPGFSTRKHSSILKDAQNIFKPHSTQRFTFITVQKPTWGNMSHLRLIVFSSQKR